MNLLLICRSFIKVILFNLINCSTNSGHHSSNPYKRAAASKVIKIISLFTVLRERYIPLCVLKHLKKVF